MKRTFFFVLLTLVSSLLFSQNLVLNPGFEAWEKISKPSGWTTAQNCLKDSSFIYSGSYSCRHEGGTKYLGQTCSIVQGKHYRLSFIYKTMITGSGNGCRIWCYWKDPEGNNLTDPATDDILRPSKYLKSEIMKQFTADVSAPSGASSFYLEVRTYANSVSFFDDFVFEENVTTLNPEEQHSDVQIYPVPANDYLTISNLKHLKQISVQSIAGRIVWTHNFSGEVSVTIPLHGLSDGLYILRIRTSINEITRKFVKKTN
jgi:hypothetical protein